MRKGEIEGRLDPNFVHLSKVLKEKFKHSNYSFVNLGKCIDYIQYGISSLANTEQKGVPIIRMGNLKGDEWDFSSLKHIELSDKDIETYRVLDGDLLFNRTNSKELVGKCGVFREKGDWVFASYLIRVRVDENLLLPDFASFFLGSSVGRMQIDCLSRQIIGMTNINAEEIKLIKIPIPPLEVQKQIIEKFESAYNAKRAKEAEAKSLLDGIDAYLLGRLGIETPAATETKKTFFTRASKLSGGRFDPKKYVPENEQLINSLSKGHFRTMALRNLITQSVSGDWGIEFEARDYVERLVIRATEFDNRQNLRLDNSRVKYRFINKSKLKRMDLQAGDLLIEKSGGSEDQPVGRIAIITDDLVNNYSLAFSNFIHKIRVDSRLVRSNYLFEYLRTVHNIKITDLMQSQTNGIRNLIMREYLSLVIPLPSLEIQEEIASHIQSIRTRAKELECEARAEVERAKAEVERMILGDVSADA
ncbi:MAG TPA: restriction endonuclease subunit S [Pyrinomonadaceae bacterium]|nr:restriction endonuclease subunit S [Pyrinomonadaceae bacterium]